MFLLIIQRCLENFHAIFRLGRRPFDTRRQYSASNESKRIRRFIVEILRRGAKSHGLMTAAIALILTRISGLRGQKYLVVKMFGQGP